jgi:hypothetical protein
MQDVVHQKSAKVKKIADFRQKCSTTALGAAEFPNEKSTTCAGMLPARSHPTVQVGLNRVTV